MSLSIQRSPELSFYYCLQSSSLSLSNSVADYRLSLLYNAKMSNLLSTPSLLCHVKASRQHLVFWVFVAGEFVTDRQR